MSKRHEVIACLLMLFAAFLVMGFTVQSAAASSHTIGPVAVVVSPFQASNSTTTTSASNNTGWFGGIWGAMVNAFKSVILPYIGNPPQIPASTLFIVGVALLLGIASSTAAKVLVDYDMVKSSMAQFTAWRKEMDKARKANDEQTLSKLTKKQQAMMKLQSRASMEQMKVTAVTFVPFLLLWYLLNAVFGQVTVAQAPFALPFVGTHFTFFTWYFLSSISLSFPIMKLFGIGTAMSGN